MPSALSIIRELEDVGLTQAKIDAAVGSSLVVRTAVIKKAQEVRDYWKSIAPVSDRPAHPLQKDGVMDEPGDYRDSIHVTYENKPSGYLVARVSTQDPKAHWLEYGSVHNSEYGYCQRTVEYFGGSSIGERGFHGVVS